MASLPPARLLLDLATVQAAVEAGMVIAERLMRGSSTDEKVSSYTDRLRALHLEIARAQFDARVLPPPLRQEMRNGEGEG